MTRVARGPESERAVPAPDLPDRVRAPATTIRPGGAGVGGKFGRPAQCVGVPRENFPHQTPNFF